jgi:hypothetical protein
VFWTRVSTVSYKVTFYVHVNWKVILDPHYAIFPNFSLFHSISVQILPSAPCSQTPSVCALPLILETKFHTNKNDRQNYSSAYFNFYVFRQQMRRQKAYKSKQNMDHRCESASVRHLPRIVFFPAMSLPGTAPKSCDDKKLHSVLSWKIQMVGGTRHQRRTWDHVTSVRHCTCHRYPRLWNGLHFYECYS